MLHDAWSLAVGFVISISLLALPWMLIRWTSSGPGFELRRKEELSRLAAGFQAFAEQRGFSYREPTYRRGGPLVEDIQIEGIVDGVTVIIRPMCLDEHTRDTYAEVLAQTPQGPLSARVNWPLSWAESMGAQLPVESIAEACQRLVAEAHERAPAFR